jgi:hypothetical protein
VAQASESLINYRMENCKSGPLFGQLNMIVAAKKTIRLCGYVLGDLDSISVRKGTTLAKIDCGSLFSTMLNVAVDGGVAS